MSGSFWPPYPPCASGTCTDAPCCSLGKGKTRWPELVGSSGSKDKDVIEKETPFVKVVFLPPGRIASTNFCCNRVYVVLNPSGKFRRPELVGSSGAKAKAVIEKETPFVKVVFLPPGRIAGTDFCCNRVYVVLNPSSNVMTVPIIG